MGLQDQYQTFVDQVRLQIMEKSVSLEAESKRLRQERQHLAARLTEIDERQKALDTQEQEVDSATHRSRGLKRKVTPI